MKALVYAEYGSAEVLQLKEIAKPTPGPDEVLIKIAAAAINEWDWAMLQGVPFANRLMSGIRRPGITVLGADVAGTIEAVGENIVNLKPGDQVFGDLSKNKQGDEMKYLGGGFAEYVCSSEVGLRQVPNYLNFVQAASLPQAGALAVQGLQQAFPIQSGQKLLINGASGGVGTLALQIARYLGAEITGVCSADKLEFVRLLGAHKVIDYRKEDFTRHHHSYDVILDVKGFHSVFDCRRALKSGGRYIMLGGGSARTMQALVLGSLLTVLSNKKSKLLIYKPNKGIDYLLELIRDGKVKPVVDRTFSLPQGIEAFRYYGEGKSRGKVVFDLRQDN